MDNLIGAEGQGFNIAMSGLNGGRINIGTRHFIVPMLIFMFFLFGCLIVCNFVIVLKLSKKDYISYEIK